MIFKIKFGSGINANALIILSLKWKRSFFLVAFWCWFCNRPTKYFFKKTAKNIEFHFYDVFNFLYVLMTWLCCNVTMFSVQYSLLITHPIPFCWQPSIFQSQTFQKTIKVEQTFSIIWNLKKAAKKRREIRIFP